MTDYALVRFAFRDPMEEERHCKITQEHLVGDGDLENCANDAEHLCKWQGITEKLENYYDIRNIDFGLGASRGPFISQYNTTTNLGYAYAVYDGFFDRSSVGYIWNESTFNELLSRITL
ncbi:hypothetical protein C2G38_2033073 [Gigaspora rosea]|uniref:Uncharacterized protein n=1 Tax=Gigaspora rosea TaxID=44941 RepID=A0A397VSS6_9GLOM|nr:hypothetical protein C2G38_2033073 [Gigaspora rosea]